MCKTSSNLGLSFFRSRVLVLMLLVVLSSSFVPAVSLAQQPTATTSEADMIETIQRFLQQLGYNPGSVDGIMGEKTRMAIRRFQRHHNLPVDGEASQELLEFLKKVKSDQDAELSKMSPNQIYVNAIQFEIAKELPNTHPIGATP